MNVETWRFDNDLVTPAVIAKQLVIYVNLVAD